MQRRADLIFESGPIRSKGLLEQDARDVGKEIADARAALAASRTPRENGGQRTLNDAIGGCW